MENEILLIPRDELIHYLAESAVLCRARIETLSRVFVKISAKLLKVEEHEIEDLFDGLYQSLIESELAKIKLLDPGLYEKIKDDLLKPRNLS